MVAKKSIIVLSILLLHCFSALTLKSQEDITSIKTLKSNISNDDIKIDSLCKYPIFALKTNLIYDLAITPNLEIEIALSKRWSFNVEFQRGWWLKNDNTFCWQIEAGGIECRYWMGDRCNHRNLTGWFIGIFSSSGFYDFQLKKDEGYRGEFYLMSGISGGYSTPIGRKLNMEFSLGVGYLSTDYKHYHIVGDELIKQGDSMRYQAVLPLKAKVSLVWVLNRNH